MPKKILVTGGAGFIGSNLCLRLLQQGHEVFCLDRIDPISRPQFQTLKNASRFHAICHDLIDPYWIDVDQIYHLACPASPIHYQRDPIHTLRTAVWGTFNMLELAKKLNIPMLQASTSEVYGNALQHPQQEDYWGNVNPVGVRSCYNEGKRAAESLCIDYYRQYNVPVRMVRIFNTYGPYLNTEDGRVIPAFITHALQGKHLEVFGDGSQTRSFQYIDDLLNGMELMLKHPTFVGPVNLGNPHECTILEVAHIILQLTESKSEIHFKPLPSDDPIRRKPNIDLAKQMLNWEPCVSLQEGLSHTISYFKSIGQESLSVHK